MILLLIYIALLQIGDVLTTEKILGNGGKELNPIMAWCFNKFGMHNTLVVKAVVVISVCVLISSSILALVAIAILYTGVVGWNLNQIRKMK